MHYVTLRLRGAPPVQVITTPKFLEHPRNITPHDSDHPPVVTLKSCPSLTLSPVVLSMIKISSNTSHPTPHPLRTSPPACTRPSPHSLYLPPDHPHSSNAIRLMIPKSSTPSPDHHPGHPSTSGWSPQSTLLSMPALPHHPSLHLHLHLHYITLHSYITLHYLM